MFPSDLHIHVMHMQGGGKEKEGKKEGKERRGWRRKGRRKRRDHSLYRQKKAVFAPSWAHRSFLSTMPPQAIKDELNKHSR